MNNEKPIDVEGMTPLIQVFNMPSAPPNGRVRWHGDTCLYLRCPDVDAAYEYLRPKGVESDPPKIAPYGMKQLYLRDPDNYGVCFQWPANA